MKTLVDSIYYYQDELGSTSHIANASGQLLDYYKYDLYGRPQFFDALNHQLSTTNYSVVDLGNGGARWMPELGLYDDRNRFMSPDLGRFLQPDPIGFKGDASNLYRYCGNDWANRTDPMGTQDNGALGEHYAAEYGAKVEKNAEIQGEQTAERVTVTAAAVEPRPNAHQLSLESRQMLGVQKSFADLETKDRLSLNISTGVPARPPRLDMVLPDDPSELPPEWEPDPTHLNPNGQRFTDGTGRYLDWHPGQAGRGGWKEEDHWHDSGHPDGPGKHLRPGTEVPDSSRSHMSTTKKVVAGAGIVGGGYLIYRAIRMAPSLAPPLWWTIPLNAATP